MSKPASIKKIRQNIWGNWNGYIGRSKVIEFGTDEFRANEWLAGTIEMRNTSWITEAPKKIPA